MGNATLKLQIILAGMDWIGNNKVASNIHGTTVNYPRLKWYQQFTKQPLTVAYIGVFSMTEYKQTLTWISNHVGCGYSPMPYLQ